MIGISVLIVDDEPLARRRLMRLLEKLNWVNRIENAVDLEDACHKIQNIKPDILLLDIQIPGGSGFDLLERLGTTIPIVIFVTAFDHHALRAFEANAIDYLTKPIEQGRFNIAMEKARLTLTSHVQSNRFAELEETISTLKKALNEQPKYLTEFWVRTLGEYLRVAVEKILRIHAERDYVRIYVEGANYLYQENLLYLEHGLNPTEFIRIHRSTIVRRSAVARIKNAPFSTLILILSDETEVRVGRTYISSIRDTLIRSNSN